MYFSTAKPSSGTIQRFWMVTKNQVADIAYPSNIPTLWLSDSDLLFSPSSSLGGHERDIEKKLGYLPDDLISNMDEGVVNELIREEVRMRRDMIWTLSKSAYGGSLSSHANFGKLFRGTKSDKIRDVSDLQEFGNGSKLTTSEKGLEVIKVEGVRVGTNNLPAFLLAMRLIGGNHDSQIEEMKRRFEERKEKDEEEDEEEDEDLVEAPGPKVKAFIPRKSEENQYPMGDVRRFSERRREKREKKQAILKAKHEVRDETFDVRKGSVFNR